MIYLDHAATTQMSEASRQAMEEALSRFYGNPSASYALARAARSALEEARLRLSRLLDCDRRALLFTSGGSESDNQAIHCGAAYGRKTGRRTIICSAFEHPAVQKSLEALVKEGFRLIALPVYQEGRVRPADLAAALSQDTCLVTVLHAQNEVGTLQPIQELAQLAHEAGALFHTDAVQSVGHVPLSFRELGVDYLSLSAHKFYGPKGVGALLIRPEAFQASFIFGGGQERGLRAGTENVAGVLSMAAALEEAVAVREEEGRRLEKLRDFLWTGLAPIPGSHRNGSIGPFLPGHLNVSFSGVPSEEALLLFDAAGIALSAGSACSTGAISASASLLAMGRSQEEARTALRFSLGRENTEEEMVQVVKITQQLVMRIRKLHQGDEPGTLQ